MVKVPLQVGSFSEAFIQCCKFPPGSRGKMNLSALNADVYIFNTMFYLLPPASDLAILLHMKTSRDSNSKHTLRGLEEYICYSYVHVMTFGNLSL